VGEAFSVHMSSGPNLQRRIPMRSVIRTLVSAVLQTAGLLVLLLAAGLFLSITTPEARGQLGPPPGGSQCPVFDDGNGGWNSPLCNSTCYNTAQVPQGNKCPFSCNNGTRPECALCPCGPVPGQIYCGCQK